MFTSALACLALTIYHEARNQDLRGQIAVAQVVLERNTTHASLTPSAASSPTAGRSATAARSHSTATASPISLKTSAPTP
jgi:hypothetical protein